jgi:hypothetical protein
MHDAPEFLYFLGSASEQLFPHSQERELLADPMIMSANKRRI